MGCFHSWLFSTNIWFWTPHSITEHIDFATPLQEPAVEPVCNANLPASMHTLDHLSGVANRGGIHYTGESQLREVLFSSCLHPWLILLIWKLLMFVDGCLVLSCLTLVLLSQVLQNLGKDKFPSLSFEQVGTRIAKVLEKVWNGVLSAMGMLPSAVTCTLKVAFIWIKTICFFVMSFLNDVWNDLYKSGFCKVSDLHCHSKVWVW